MKKLLLALLGVLIALPAMAQKFAYEYEGQTVNYTISSKTEKTVCTYYGSSSTIQSPGSKVSGDLVLPEKVIYNGTEYTLTEISYRSFSSTSLNSVVIPSTVSKIGEEAFGRSYVKTVTIGEGLRSIGKSAFSQCSYLKSVSLPQSLETIADYAFSHCTRLAEIELPQNLQSIGSAAFRECSALPSIVIPENVTTLPGSLFYGCKSLKTVELPKALNSIDGAVFSGCSSLTSIDIPQSVTEIGGGAFYGCSSLASVNIPDNITAINDNTFSGCSSLAQISIPANVTIIGKGAFDDCSSLTGIDIPNNITAINDYTFSGCSSLAQVSIPANVTTIGRSAFSGCTALNSVTLPSTLDTIAAYVFQNCSSLATLDIPASVNSIGAQAFSGCTSLTTLKVPDGVTAIENSTFAGCTSLSGLTLSDNITEFGESAFKGCSSLTDIKIPAGSVSIAKSTFEGCASLTAITIPESVESIDASAFKGCSSLESLILPQSLKTLGTDAFRECTSLTMVAIPASLTEISNNAFYGCKALTRLSIPEGVTTIGDGAFRECASLYTVALPSTLTKLYSGSFYDCTNLKKAAVPSSMPDYSLKYIKAEKFLYDPAEGKVNGWDIESKDGTRLVFAGVHPVETNSIQSNITKVAPEALSLLGYKLTVALSVESGPTPIEFEEGAFDKVSIRELYLDRNVAPESKPFPATIPSLRFGNHISIINDNLFAGFDKITSLVFPPSLKTIGQKSFQGCTLLETLTLSSSLESVGADAFAGCPNIKSVIPTGEKACMLSPSSFDYTTFKTAQVPLPSTVDLLSYRNSDTNWPLFTNITDDGTGGERYEFDGLLYRIISEGGVEVINSESYAGLTDVEIPEGITRFVLESDNSGGMSGVLHQYSVVGIAPNAFTGLAGLTSVTLPDAVEEIGVNAFKDCTALATINFGKGLKRINTSAFENCRKLTSVDLTETQLETIVGSAFAGCTGITKFIPAPTVKTIGDHAFYGCTNLADFDFSKASQLEYIGQSAFQRCQRLKSTLSFSPSLEYIADYAFERAMSVTNLEFAKEGKLRHIGKHAFENAIRISSLTLPESVEYVGNQAFATARMMTKVEFPANGRIEVGDSVFYACQKLENAISVGSAPGKSLGAYAFSGCTLLETVDLKFNKIGTYAFNDNAALTRAYIEGRGTLEDYAFKNCPALTFAKLDIDTIGSHQGEDCVALDSLDLSGKVRYIKNFAFYKVSALTSVEFGLNLEKIGTSAFSGTKLDKIVFPSAEEPNPIIEVEDYNLPITLTELRLGNRTKYLSSLGYSPSLNERAQLDVCDLGTTIQTLKWNLPLSRSAIVIPASLQGSLSFSPGAYSYKTPKIIFEYSPEPLKITNSSSQSLVADTLVIDRVLSGADICTDNIIFAEDPTHQLDISLSFLSSRQKSLKSMHVGSSVKNLTSRQALSIEKVSFSEGVESINSLTACNKEIRYPGSLTTIKNFHLNANTEKVSFADGMADLAITSKNFSTPSSLTLKEAYIGRSITGLDDLFANIPTLKRAVIGNDADSIHAPVTSLPKGIFKGCTALENAVLTDHIASIGAEAFDGCSSLKIVSFPASLTSIGEYAYRGCSALDRIVARGMEPVDNVTVFDPEVESTVPLFYPDPAEDAYWFSTTYALFDLRPHSGNIISNVTVDIPEEIEEKLDEMEAGESFSVELLLVEEVLEEYDSADFRATRRTPRRRAAADGTSPSYGKETPIYWFAPNPEALSITEEGTVTVLKDEPAEIWAIALDGSDKKAVISVNNFILGDLTGDKVLNTSDVNTLAGHISLPEGSTVRLKVADMNGDGNIDTADLNILIQNISKN